MSQPPADPDAFKRALAITTRAIAGDKDLDVRYGGEIAGFSGGRIVLPNPGPEPTPEAAAARAWPGPTPLPCVWRTMTRPPI